MKLDAPATHRNRGPLTEVLGAEIERPATVLEIASGTGQHAAHWVAALPGLRWLPSDPGASERASIDAWCAGVDGVEPAIHLDVLGPWPSITVDAVFCANLVHIAPWECTPALMAGSARCLRPGGRLLVYGPFRVGGGPMVPSNEDFHRSLVERNPAWGVRDREAVVAEAEAVGLRFDGPIAMPANNQVLRFTRS